MRQHRYTVIATWGRVACACLILVLAAVPGCSAIDAVIAPATESSVRRIAILPFAHRAEGQKGACPLCPDPVVMDVVAEEQALLVTAFFYEEMAKYPRFSIVPASAVERAWGKGGDGVVDRLLAREDIDAVLVGALLELREAGPHRPRAGAAVYAALLESDGLTSLWSGFFNEDALQRTGIGRYLNRLIGDGDEGSMSALGVAHYGTAKLVERLAGKAR